MEISWFLPPCVNIGISLWHGVNTLCIFTHYLTMFYLTRFQQCMEQLCDPAAPAVWDQLDQVILSSDWLLVHNTDLWLVNGPKYWPLIGHWSRILSSDWSMVQNTGLWLVNRPEYWSLIGAAVSRARGRGQWRGLAAAARHRQEDEGGRAPEPVPAVLQGGPR